MENDAASILENKFTGGSAGGKNLVSFQMKSAVNIWPKFSPPPHQPSHKLDKKALDPREQKHMSINGSIQFIIFNQKLVPSRWLIFLFPIDSLQMLPPLYLWHE